MGVILMMARKGVQRGGDGLDGGPESVDGATCV